MTASKAIVVSDKHRPTPESDAPSGTPAIDDDICPACHGTRRFDGAECVTCAGTGVVVESVGA
jgi:hypothetical protein